MANDSGNEQRSFKDRVNPLPLRGPAILDAIIAIRREDFFASEEAQCSEGLLVGISVIFALIYNPDLNSAITPSERANVPYSQSSPIDLTVKNIAGILAHQPRINSELQKAVIQAETWVDEVTNDAETEMLARNMLGRHRALQFGLLAFHRVARAQAERHTGILPQINDTEAYTFLDECWKIMRARDFLTLGELSEKRLQEIATDENAYEPDEQQQFREKLSANLQQSDMDSFQQLLQTLKTHTKTYSDIYNLTGREVEQLMHIGFLFGYMAMDNYRKSRIKRLGNPPYPDL